MSVPAPHAASEALEALVERIGEFLSAEGAVRRSGDSDTAFARLALEVFAAQYRHVEPYRRLCDTRCATPETVDDWRRAPAVPTLAFRSLELAAAPAREIFRSSGTSGGGRSVHHHPFPELYRRTIDATFPHYCLPGGTPRPILSLVPPRRQLPDSSLSFMAEHVLERHGAEGSETAFGAGGVEIESASAWADARRAENRPGLVFATAFALADWLDALEDEGRRFALPSGTVIFETGGFKGRRRELERAELVARAEALLGVPRERIVREYGMSELTGQFYTRVLEGGDPDLFVEPPAMRARVLDPLTLDELPAGEKGVLAIFDLANVGSAAHVLTQDLALAEAGGFRLLGRARGAELRGCSLVAEELQTYSPAEAT